jgi:hypothetical protein
MRVLRKPGHVPAWPGWRHPLGLHHSATAAKDPRSGARTGLCHRIRLCHAQFRYRRSLDGRDARQHQPERDRLADALVELPAARYLGLVDMAAKLVGEADSGKLTTVGRWQMRSQVERIVEILY